MNSIKAQEKRFSEFFSNRIDFMLHQSVGLSKLDHKGLRGRFRELLVRDLFEYLVPRTCSITYGTVVDSRGERFDPNGPRKTEDDILIVDRECLPPFFEFGKEGVYPIESVLARIEVKSSLDFTALKDSVAGASSFSKLKPSLRRYSPDLEMETAQVLFAFKSQYKKPETAFDRLEYLMDEVDRSNGTHSELPIIRHLCIPCVGYWVYTDFEGELGWYHCDADPDDYSEVLSFVALLLHELPAIRDARRKATLGTYIGCLRERRLKRVD